MSDIFSLFDGKMGAGAASTVTAQSADSFSDVSSENDLITRLASGSDMINPTVDYSDFANFVTFNSAESLVSVTADQILNDYPFGGTVDDHQSFLNSLDGYQKHFLGLWPSRVGHLRFNPAVSSSYVKIDDFGVQDGAARSSFISPGTGSMSVQGWIDVPTITGSDAIVVFQKLKLGTTEGLTLYVSNSNLYFHVKSGSADAWVVSGAVGNGPRFFSAVVDRGSSPAVISLYTATTGTFPVLSDSVSATVSSRFDLFSGSFYFGSGSLIEALGKTVVPFTGSVDDVSVWASARGLSALTSSYNRKIYSQSGLVGAWRFNEASTSTPLPYASIVKDCSGHRLDGRIQSYFSGSRGSGSLAYDSEDPILFIDDPNVFDYIVQAQMSGALYDRGNGSLIFNLFPEAFSLESETFKNFALIIARFFDRTKLYINQLPNLRKIDYSDYDNAPDELLEDVASALGWQLDGSFATTDALQYFVGRDVSAGTQANATPSTRMSDIKARFWRRILQNVMYMYKTKGTRESVEALLRVYGVNNNFVKLKEYARKAEARIPVSRVVSEKSVYSLAFGLSGSSGSISKSGFDVGSSGDFSAEFRVKFPISTSDEIPPTQLSGELVTFYSSSLAQYPLSAAAMSATVGYGSWDAGYLFDESSGYLLPTFGSPVLTGSVGLIYGSAGFNGATDKAISFYSFDQVEAPAADFNVGVGDDYVFLWVAKYPTVTGPATTTVLKLNGDNVVYADGSSGAYLTYVTDTPMSHMSYAQAPDGSDFKGQWHVGMVVLDRSTNKLRIGSRNLETGVVLASAETDVTGFTDIISNGLLLGTQTDREIRMSAFYYSIGAGVATGISANFSTVLQNFANSLEPTVWPASVVRLLYEKQSATALTGNLFLTSSSGRVTHLSASIFDGNFYNLSIVRETATGSITLNTTRYENDVEMHNSSTVSTSGYPVSVTFNNAVLGSYTGSVPEFYGQELRVWDDSLETIELLDHAKNFESYGRLKSINNSDLKVHWRLNDGITANASGSFSVYDSTENANDGAASGFTPSINSFIKSLFSQATIPNIDYGWNQEKVRVYDGSSIDENDRYDDERFASLEFNMYDALNDDISHLIASYDELNNVIGHPMNKYRNDYEGLQQMRETYFKRLQGQLNFGVFVEMLDFFDSTFVSIIQRLIPARTVFKGDEIVIESHMLERPKYQYGFRPVREGTITLSGSISIIDRNEDWK